MRKTSFPDQLGCLLKISYLSQKTYDKTCLKVALLQWFWKCSLWKLRECGEGPLGHCWWWWWGPRRGRETNIRTSGHLSSSIKQLWYHVLYVMLGIYLRISSQINIVKLRKKYFGNPCFSGQKKNRRESSSRCWLVGRSDSCQVEGWERSGKPWQAGTAVPTQALRLWFLNLSDSRCLTWRFWVNTSGEGLGSPVFQQLPCTTQREVAPSRVHIIEHCSIWCWWRWLES